MVFFLEQWGSPIHSFKTECEKVSSSPFTCVVCLEDSNWQKQVEALLWVAAFHNVKLKFHTVPWWWWCCCCLWKTNMSLQRTPHQTCFLIPNGKTADWAALCCTGGTLTDGQRVEVEAGWEIDRLPVWLKSSCTAEGHTVGVSLRCRERSGDDSQDG